MSSNVVLQQEVSKSAFVAPYLSVNRSPVDCGVNSQCKIHDGSSHRGKAKIHPSINYSVFFYKENSVAPILCTCMLRIFRVVRTHVWCMV